ncbi:MAG: alpha/beta hydrolase [Hyphomicrobiaceae bacterium]
MRTAALARLANPVLLILALLAIAVSLGNLRSATGGITAADFRIGDIPARVYRALPAQPAPVVVIAHGFAGSQQLMQSFAFTFARNGYIAVTFDYAGHGRNPRPLTGSITEETGATRTLVAETARVAAFARGLGDGRLAVLGHSMASDIVVRFAQETPGVAATIAVSMFSPAVTETRPANLLVLVGDWEGMLKAEALRVVGLAAAPVAAKPGTTYGSLADGTARRTAFSPSAEHVAVLFSATSMAEALDWLDGTFAVSRTTPPELPVRGPWILLLLAGAVVAARPLSALLPVVSDPPAGAGLSWSRLWLPVLAPMIVTPLLLRVLPTHFLPVLVGDYLAAHFAVYGLVTGGLLLGLRPRPAGPSPLPARRWALAAGAAGLVLYGFAALVWPIDALVTSFQPGPERIALVLAMLAGTLAFFLSDEWLTRGTGAGRGAYPASKIAFLVSLAIAVALDFSRLFFLVILIPIIVLFFVVHGLFSAWAYRRTGHRFVGAIANAVAFAWAIGVTFPLLAG